MSKLNRHIKCVFVISSLDVGGSEKQLLNYVQHRPSNVDVVVCYLEAEPHGLLQDFRQAGANPCLISRAGRSRLSFALSLYRFMRRAAPDVVCTFLSGTPGTFGRLCAWLAGVKRIYHSDRGLDLSVGYLHQMLRPFLDRSTRRLIPNSQAIAEQLMSMGIPRNKISVIPNAIDTHYLDRRCSTGLRDTLQIDGSSVVGGFLGRFRPEKKVEDIVAALQSLPLGRRPDYFLFGGDGPTLERVKNLAAREQWSSERCRFLGLINDTRSFLATLDFFVLSSLTEGTPNAVLEAMAMELPVVATRICDLPEIISGVGYLALPSDTASLAVAIERMTAVGPAARQSMGTLGRQKVLADWEAVMSRQKLWDILLSDFP